MDEIDVRESTVEGLPAVAVSGELKISTAPALRDVLVKHVKKKSAPLLMLDLSGLAFMDTSGLATLIEAHITAERSAGKLVLFGLSPRIAEVFDVTQVTKLFSICDTQGEAVAFLGSLAE
ncbi:MAG: STAS domain-containing protein [Planctomycetota bacterium]|jgi:anti-sigma B factor antagonist